MLGEVRLVAGEEEVEGWRLDLEFSSSVDWLESVMAEPSGAGPQWSLTSRSSRVFNNVDDLFIPQFSPDTQNFPLSKSNQ